MKRFHRLTAFLLLGTFAGSVSAEEREVTPEQLEAIQNGGEVAPAPRPEKLPDLTKGEDPPVGKFPPQLWYLGPTGITGFMIGDFAGDQFQVQGTVKGSPAEGKFLWGDVIVGMNGKKFTAGGHLGQVIGNAIIEAEKAENQGKISFLVWRDKNYAARFGRKDVNSVDVDKLFDQASKDDSLYDWKPEEERKLELKKMGLDEFPLDPVTLEIGLTLRVFPAYSDTAPYDCPKTKQILEDAWKVLAARFASDPQTGKPGKGGVIEAMALVASGKPEHRKIVREWVRGPNSPWQPPKEPIGSIFHPDYKGYKGFQSWHMGFVGLNCALYYDATGDEYVRPALEKFAIETAMGQSSGGSWGHTFAYPSFNGGRLHGMNPGYGALNAAGNRCFLLIVLARKLGVQHPEIDGAIGRARRFFGSYVDQGGIPYGDHAAADTDDSNGKNAGTAHAMKLLGDDHAAKYFALMSAHASFTARGGHAHDYHTNWSTWGASLCGPEVRTLAERNMRWRRTLCRMHDGSFVYISPSGRYRTLRDPTATEVLHQAAPLKQTLISGKDANEALRPSPRELGQLLASAQAQFNDPWLDAKAGTPWIQRTTDELFDLLDIFMPKTRRLVAEELGRRFLAGEKDIAPRLAKLLDHENPRFRDAGLRGLNACGPDTVLGHLSAITQRLEDAKDFVRITAVNVIAKSTGNEETQLALLKATVQEPQAAPPNSVRNAAQSVLFAAQTKLASAPFEAGFDEDLVEGALEKLITLDPVSGPGFVGSRKDVWSKDTVVRLAGPLTFVAEEEQVMDQMFANRAAPARALLEKFGYREAFASSAHQLRLKAALPRDIRPGSGFKRPMIDPEAVRKQPAVFREFTDEIKRILTDDPATLIEYKDASLKPRVASLDQLLALIEADTTAVKLPSLAADARALFQRRLDAAEGTGAKLKICRDELKDPARKNTFAMLGAMDFLAATLGPDALADLVPYLGHEQWRLRELSRKLAAEQVLVGGPAPLVEAFGQSSEPAVLAGILDVLVAAKAKGSLPLAQKAMTHDAAPVRQAAVKAAFALGGDAVFPEILAHLKQARAAEDLRGCEDALLSRRSEPAHLARLRDALLAMQPEVSGSVRASVLWMLGQIGDAPSLAALAKLARTEDPVLLGEIVTAFSYSPSREADQRLLEIAAAGKNAAKIAGAQSARRMVIGPKGFGDVPPAARLDFADAMLGHVLDPHLIRYLGNIHEARALRMLASCLRQGVQSAAESLIRSAEGMPKLPPAEAAIAAKALKDVIEFIEVNKLRGGMEKHMDKDENYVGWKALQARAGKALLKFHNPAAAPIRGFDYLELNP